MNTNTLNPENPRRGEFVARLEKVVFTDGCHHYSYGCAEEIMHQMGDIDVARSIVSLQDRGGCCDCEIIFNVSSG